MACRGSQGWMCRHEARAHVIDRGQREVTDLKDGELASD